MGDAVVKNSGYQGLAQKCPTQGENLKDLGKGLREIYGWIKDGTLKLKEQTDFNPVRQGGGFSVLVYTARFIL